MGEVALPELSIVVPLYNEAASILSLGEQVTAACQPLGRSYEIVAVDDGSRDGAWEQLVALRERDPSKQGQTPRTKSSGFSAWGLTLRKFAIHGDHPLQSRLQSLI